MYRYIGICLLFVHVLAAGAADFYIGPQGNDANPGTPEQPFATISQGIAQAVGGDRVLLLPGVYRQNTEIRRSGLPEKPIVITSSSTDPAQFAVIDGGAEPGLQRGGEGFRLIDASWITIRNLDFVNCWTDVIALTRSTYISVQGCRFRDCGQHAVATGSLGTHHILVENCTWSQDERIWTTWDWAELHHGELAHYNGGLYGGRAGSGSAIIRGNTVRYAFNGLRWWLKEGEKGKAQSNIEIYDNLFEYCLDNFVEPEVFTANLHIYHNIFDSCPNGVFSIDRVEGGPIFIYGNVGRWSRDNGSKARPWTIYKFAQYGNPGWLDEPLFIYHNSWDYMNALGASGGDYKKAEDHIRHFNNAYLFQGGKDFGFVGWQGRDSQFDYDISSAPWPADLTQRGFEEHGLVGDPGFADPSARDYRLQASSPAIDGGVVLEDFTQWYLGAQPDMGAYEGDQRIYGPPFQFQPEGTGGIVSERPRIVRCFARGSQLALFFSTALNPEGIVPANIRLRVEDRTIAVAAVHFPGPPRAMLISLSRPVTDGATIDLELTPLPMGLNGEQATMWGADLRVVGIPLNADLVGEMAQVFAQEEKNTPSSIDTDQSSLPQEHGLSPGYPNPFNQTILLPYQVASQNRVLLDIFDTTGQRVRRLVDTQRHRGRYQIGWNGTAGDGTELATGTYLVQLQVDDFSQRRKVTLLK
ncbi:MAG: T9SS type A sorting domain-containing protein [Candidatus Latescibacteria bacterium]|nr:T9SS type A sorting domain-containing protein [Candidatus Latescibacterota bacterium]